MIARLLSALSLLVLLAVPARAEAQGRCRCNMGCHQYPGQCVSRGGEGCDLGYAPFCGTRAGTCPSAGWVTCNGECTCVRLGPSDAGTSLVDATIDAPTNSDVPPPTDRVAPMDQPTSTDAPRVDATSTSDVIAPTDRSASLDQPTSTDSPRADAPVSDAPVSVSDAPVSVSDAPVSVSDAPVSTSDLPVPSGVDGGAPGDSGVACACDGGACFNGYCPSARCRYEAELGFICPIPGESCRVIGEEAWCVPACLDVQCPGGATCDPRTGTCIEVLCDAQRPCPTGARCVANRCEPVVDAATADGATNPASQQGGCGCRTAHRAGAPRGILALIALAALRKRRTRAAQRSNSCR